MQTPQNIQDRRQPIVSFVVTGYNLPAALLSACIDSITALSLASSEREIILIDDGSQQSPIAQLRQADEIIYVRQLHQGLSAARNTGLRIACGEYVQFIDGDDALTGAPYEHCIDLLRFERPDMVVFDFTRSTPAGHNYQDLPPQSGSAYMRHHNIHGTACGYIARRTTIGDLRFTPGILHEDEEFTPLLLLRAETVIVTDAQAYYYRQRPGSITSDRQLRGQLRRLSDLCDIIRRLKAATDRYPAEDQTALQRRVAQLTMDYLYQVIVITQSRHFLDRKTEALRRYGLFPLPDRDYTAKYTWFRRLTTTSAGLNILIHTIPLMNKER